MTNTLAGENVATLLIVIIDQEVVLNAEMDFCTKKAQCSNAQAKNAIIKKKRVLTVKMVILYRE